MVNAECSGSHLAVSVSDNGRPISGPDRERLFKRFQQLDGSDRREHGGTGLGLAICKEIVEQHHGRIFYRPGEGGGNLFTFTVPVYGEEA
jgi:signal transduction histidine kinase